MSLFWTLRDFIRGRLPDEELDSITAADMESIVKQFPCTQHAQVAIESLANIGLSHAFKLGTPVIHPFLVL